MKIAGTFKAITLIAVAILFIAVNAESAQKAAVQPQKPAVQPVKPAPAVPATPPAQPAAAVKPAAPATPPAPPKPELKLEGLVVGPGREFAKIEDALAKAKPGDIINVLPLENDKPYENVALFVNTEKLTIKAINSKGRRVKLSGKGFDYSGKGTVPRAIVQFNRGASGCTLEGFEIFGAHNQSHNGAGVRITFANNVTIRGCDIHSNDMGVMSNGDGTGMLAANQVIENCIIRENGDTTDPGYNHNLYLGGASATVRFCEIYGSLTGNNIKSRARINRIEYCYIHDSANREVDLVDAAVTEKPGSDSILIGNIIVKADDCKGNRAVIHFGQDGDKQHDGTIFLIHNTIIQPYITSVVDLSSAKANALLIGNIIWDGGSGQKNAKLIVASRNGANAANGKGMMNWVSDNFKNSVGGTGLLPANNIFAEQAPPFANPKKHDVRLASAAEKIVGAGHPVEELKKVLAAQGWNLQDLLKYQYKHPAECEDRPAGAKLDLGAFQHVPQPKAPEPAKPAEAPKAASAPKPKQPAKK